MTASSRRARLVALTLFAAIALVACGRKDRGEPSAPPPPAAPMQASASLGAMEKRAPAVESTSAADAAPMQRFVAVRQELRAEVAPEQLADAWAKVRDLCGTLQCELLSSSLLREAPQQPGEGQLEMRVLPADVDKLLGGLAGVSTVVSHVTTAEDKTAEVIDVEARIRNRTEFRDSLRLMLGDKVTKRTMSDLLEIQRTLSDTQAELDASATQRKVLAQQTSKQHIQIQFTPKRSLVRGGDSYNPMTRALRDAGAVLAESVGTLITFVAAVLPWLVLVVLPVGWLLRWAFRRRRRSRAA
ncbi:MAG: DUF4349 domain-containing protein [Pseudomonadota bacterium]